MPAYFHTFAFGDETIHNAKLRIADLFREDKEVAATDSHIPGNVAAATNPTCCSATTSSDRIASMSRLASARSMSAMSAGRCSPAPAPPIPQFSAVCAPLIMSTLSCLNHPNDR